MLRGGGRRALPRPAPAMPHPPSNQPPSPPPPLSPPCLQVGGVRRFVDISVPRNIAPQLNELEGAIVYNVDDLKEVRG